MKLPEIPDDAHPGVVLVLFAVAAVVLAALLTIVGRLFAGGEPEHRDDLVRRASAEPKPKTKGPGDETAKADRIAKLRAGAEAARKRKAEAKAAAKPAPPAVGGAT